MEDRIFSRDEIGGLHQYAIDMGTAKGVFKSSRHFVAIKPEQNICPPDLGALGEPIVIISSRSKCDDFLEALAVSRRMYDGTMRKAINIFVFRDKKEWVYRGVYQLVFDGSQEHALRLFPGPNASVRVPEHIRVAVESRIDAGHEREAAQAMLKGWGWRPSVEVIGRPRRKRKTARR